MKNLFSNLALVLFIVFLVSSCSKPSNSSTVPVISFKEFHYFKDAAGKDTSLNIVVHFEDGDGDIGYLDNEFFKCNVPLSNLFIYYELKTGNNFAPVVFYDPWAELNDACDTVALHDSLQLHFEGRMTFIQPTGSNKSIEGDVSYHLTPTNVRFLYKDASAKTAQGRFRINIIDRAGNKSNSGESLLSSVLELSR